MNTFQSIVPRLVRGTQAHFLGSSNKRRGDGLFKMLFHCLFFISGIFLLSSCGFHLRGTEPLAPPLHHLYLETKEPYGHLARLLKQSLKQSGALVTDAPQEATAVLTILSERQTQHLLGVGGTQQTRVYALTLTVAYQLTLPSGIVILPKQEATETRTITIQASQILGGSNEESNSYQQMYRAILFTIMRRLGSNEVTNAFLHQPPTKTLTS